MKVLAHRLRKRLKDLDMTQRALAMHSNISLQLINWYANGKVLPDTYTLCELADSLHTSPDYLLGYKKEVK